MSCYFSAEMIKETITTTVPSPRPEAKKRSYIMDKLIILRKMGEFIHKLLLFKLLEMLNDKCRRGLYFNAQEAAFLNPLAGPLNQTQSFSLSESLGAY